MTQQCAYDGPDTGSLPVYISRVVSDLQRRLPAEAAISLSVNLVQAAEPGMAIYRRIYASDDRGLVQTVYYEGGSAYVFRIEGDLPEGTRESAMGYVKSNVRPVSTPKQPAPRGSPFDYPWLIEVDLTA